MKLVSGRANVELSDGIANHLGTDLAKMSVKDFPDGEIYVEILENVRGEDMFVIQPTSSPAHANILELLIIIDALRRGSADRITAVIPYFGYARQDRKTGPRTPISSKLVANLIVAAGAHRVFTIDLHAGQIQGFFDVPTDNLIAGPVFARDIKERSNNAGKSLGKPLIVSPDAGGAVRARFLAGRVDGDFAIVDKKRDADGKSHAMNIIGDPKGRRCIIVDDIVDSAGTLCNAAEALMDAGAVSVSSYATHGVLSGRAIETVSNSVLDELVITDTIRLNKQTQDCKKIRVISMVPLISEAIRRIANSESVSVLFT